MWSTGCKSWYLTRTGKNTTLWPGFTFEYRWRTRRLDPADYEQAPVAARAAAAGFRAVNSTLANGVPSLIGSALAERPSRSSARFQSVALRPCSRRGSPPLVTVAK